jgi:hypothetical protein
MEVSIFVQVSGSREGLSVDRSGSHSDCSSREELSVDTSGSHSDCSSREVLSVDRSGSHSDCTGMHRGVAAAAVTSSAPETCRVDTEKGGSFHY